MTGRTGETFAVSYIRYSTPEQARGGSYFRQYEQTQEYCKRKGLVLLEDRTYFDKGVSAFHGKNKISGKLAQLLSDARSGLIPKGTRLIVESLDRLGRDEVTSQMTFFLELLNEGLTIVTLGCGEAEYGKKSDFGALITALVIMSRANEESAIKSVRGRKTWEQKRKNLAERPLTAIVPYWLENRKNQIVARPERVKIVQEIFDMALQGMGRRVIAKRLNERGIPVWGSPARNKSGLWRDTYVAKIFMNRAVLGEFQPHLKKDRRRVPVGEPVKDYYPAIVAEDVFLAVQQKIASRAHRGGRATYKAGNLFSGRLRCLRCGGALHYQDKGKFRCGNNPKWVACERRLFSVEPCPAKAFRYNALEEAILSEMVHIDWPSLLSEGAGEKQLLPSDEIAALEFKSKQINSKIGNLLDVIADGTVSAAITGRLAKFEADLIQAESDLKRLKRTREAANRDRRMALDSFSVVGEFSQLAERPEMRLKLKRHIDDLLQKTYVRHDEGELTVAMFFHGGGFSYRSGGIKFRYEKDDEDLAALLPSIIPPGELESLLKWEPALTGAKR